VKRISLLVIGAGNRGYGYAAVAGKKKELFQVVGVADPNDSRRNQVKQEHGLEESACFLDWREVLSLPKMADCVLICTQDHMHFEPAMAAIEKGYHILLEKPISPDPRECLAIEEKANRLGKKITVCHVLRYTNFWGKLKELIDSEGWTSNTTKQSFALDDVVSVKINGGSNTGKAYNGDHIRIYATDSPAGTITISLAEGYELVSIKITTVTGTYAFLYVDGTTTDICNKATAVSGSSVKLNSVKNGSDGKQVRVTAIEVVYKTV